MSILLYIGVRDVLRTMPYIHDAEFFAKIVKKLYPLRLTWSDIRRWHPIAETKSQNKVLQLPKFMDWVSTIFFLRLNFVFYSTFTNSLLFSLSILERKPKTR